MLVSVVVPVKEERDNVQPLAERVRAALQNNFDWELIFVDDGSVDDTFTQIEKLTASDSRIKAVRLRRCFGQSAATQAGFDVASGDVIVTMDGDLQNDPADIPAMLTKLNEGYDAVLGLREKRKDGFMLRLLPSLTANLIIRKVLKIPFKDFGCALRVVRKEFVNDVPLYGEMHRFITALLLQQGARIAQLPVRHHPRTAGKSKYSISRTIRVVLDLMTVKFLGTFQTRPMHLFGSVGLLSLGLGGVGLLISLIMKYTTGPGMTANPLFLLGAMMSLMGVQFLTLGLIGEVAARTYFESQGKSHYAIRERRNIESTTIRANDLKKAA
jgi:glycosyltransferase involved in cell wall biosynthesis